MPDPTPSPNLCMRCPAKLNLTLAVAAPRHDQLHPLASVMVALQFGDDLQLRRLEHGPSTFAIHLADDAPKPQPIDWPIEQDLAYRAHAMLQEALARPLPVASTLNKRIPWGAGLGGGSSNAAGMLLGLRALFEQNLPDEVLLEIARSLGADVVFLLHALLGQPAALVSGIGELIEPIATLPDFDCVLVFPDGVCPTADVYRAYDRLARHTDSMDLDRLAEDWRGARALPAAYNDLTPAAVTICPRIEPAIQTITSLGYEPRLTGSGSALFLIVDSQHDAFGIAQELRRVGLYTCATGFKSLSSKG